MGLSARTREETGHCSNAGGLSAVLREPLYTIPRGGSRHALRNSAAQNLQRIDAVNFPVAAR